MKNEIVIKPKFELKEYFKANLYLTYNTLIYKIFLVLYIIIILINLFLLIFGSFTNFNFELYHLIFFAGPFFSLYLIFIRTKSSLKNSKLKEKINVTYNKDFFEEIGETYKIKYNWTDIYKLIETKTWYLIYIQKKQAKIIIKKDLSINENNELKELFNSLNIKKRLM